ncbi:MAG TPA: FhaA domain-containing protein [Jatrophihabitans sp.]|nr:FhaA domain-containing protein [Jatrophihabitans sp.]
MSLAQRFERRLEGMVGSAFARVFKGQVEPVEIGNALQREAMDKKAVMGSGQVLAPNRYRVTLSTSDYERLSPWEAQLTASLAELVQEYLDDNQLHTIGDIEVYLAEDAALHTGVFGVASRMEPQAPPRRRPYDSMSMPVVPGHPDQYVDPLGNAPQEQSAPVPPAFPPPVAFPHPPPQPEYQPAYPAQPDYPQADYPQPYADGAYQHAGYQEQPRRRPAYQASLTVDGTPRTLELKDGSNLIGRGSDADLQLMDQGVSRRHADVYIQDNRAHLQDLGSTNGTSINGHPVQSQQLQHGDVIRVGHTRLVFREDTS